MLIFLNEIIGVLRVVEEPSRSSSPSFAIARDALPMPLWGAVFLSLAGLLAVAGIVENRWMTYAVAGTGLVVWTGWAFLIAAAAVRSVDASYVGAVLYIAGASRHFQAFHHA